MNRCDSFMKTVGLRRSSFLLVFALLGASFYFPCEAKQLVSISDLIRKLQQSNAKNEDGTWTGRWFPAQEKPSNDGAVQDNSMDLWKTQMSLQHAEMISMANDFCDNGKANLTLDFPDDDAYIVCHSRDRFIAPDYLYSPLLTKYPVPSAFVPTHKCMNETIEYPFPIPSFGPHRPVWAAWGEYDYLPPQRWIHNLEHGGIVMLYDPCAHHFLVNQLKDLVRNCLVKHIITPFKLSHDRPLALVAWGWSITMATLDKQEAVEFIKNHVNRAPEAIDESGKYNLHLRVPASAVSDSTGEVCVGM